MAVVVKAGTITGSAETRKGTAGTTYYQILSGFNAPFLDSLALQKRSVDTVLVIASKRFTEEARASLERCADRDWRGRVTLWDGDELFKQFQRHLGPAALPENLRGAFADASAFDEHYELLPIGPGLKGKAQVAYLEDDLIRLVVAEKFPGSSRAAPFKVKVSGTVPRDVAEKLRNPAPTGTSVSIPGEGLRIEYPPILQALFQDQPLQEIRIGYHGARAVCSEPPRQLRLRLEVFKDSAPLAVWGPTTLLARDRHEDGLAWSNQHEASGLLASVEIHPDRPVDSRFSLGVDVPSEGIRVEELARALEFLEALSAGDKLVIHNDTEGRSAEEDLARSSFGSVENSGFDLVRCLLAIQRRYGLRLILKSIEICPEEYYQIIELGHLILDGEVGFSNFELVGTPETRDALYSQIAGKPSVFLSGPRTYRFLGFETTERLDYHFTDPRLDCNELKAGQLCLGISGSTQVLRFHDITTEPCVNQEASRPSALSSGPVPSHAGASGASGSEEQNHLTREPPRQGRDWQWLAPEQAGFPRAGSAVLSGSSRPDDTPADRTSEG